MHGFDGLDEISNTDKTLIAHVEERRACGSRRLDPARLRLRDASRSNELQVTTIEDAAQVIRDVLDGVPGPKRDIVELNAAAALTRRRHRREPRDRVSSSRNIAIDSGAAQAFTRDRWRRCPGVSRQSIAARSVRLKDLGQRRRTRSPSRGASPTRRRSDTVRSGSAPASPIGTGSIQRNQVGRFGLHSASPSGRRPPRSNPEAAGRGRARPAPSTRSDRRQAGQLRRHVAHERHPGVGQRAQTRLVCPAHLRRRAAA